MSDSPWAPGVIEELLRQAAWKREQDAIEARRTPTERKIRAKFDEAMKGETIDHLLSLSVTRPEHCVVFAQAYAAEASRLRATAPPPTTKKQLKAMDPEWIERNAKTKAKLLDLAARHEVASNVCIGLFLAMKGHDLYMEWFKTHRIQAVLPPLPKGWRKHWDSVMRQMVSDFVPAPRVSVLPTPLTAR